MARLLRKRKKILHRLRLTLVLSLFSCLLLFSHACHLAGSAVHYANSSPGLCTCHCLSHLKCSWWKCAHGSPAPLLACWLKEHLSWRACSGHSTPNIIIHFLSPFLFHFFSSHWLLFSFIALRIYYLFVYFYLTALRRVVSQYLLNEWFSKPSNNLNFTFAGWWKGNLFLRNYGAIW